MRIVRRRVTTTTANRHVTVTMSNLTIVKLCVGCIVDIMTGEWATTRIATTTTTIVIVGLSRSSIKGRSGSDICSGGGVR